MNTALYPVLRQTPEHVLCLERKEKVQALSKEARKSARASALKSALSISEFKKDEQDVPIPEDGIYWSVSHKKSVVAGVVARFPVGIDVEIVRPVSEGLLKRVVSAAEFEQFSKDDRESVFFRTFTAKEAVLKKTGVGIAGLSEAKIYTVVDKTNLVVSFQENKYWVENFFSGRYLAAVTKDQCKVQWSLE